MVPNAVFAVNALIEFGHIINITVYFNAIVYLDFDD